MASTESREKKWSDLDITPDEVERISKALKNEEFRKLFVEYAEEISDPVNRRRYEEEIAQMENERGMDITFLHPQPGYVLKTTVVSRNDGEVKKAFINICSNENIEKPSSECKVGSDGRKGLQWSIPHSFSPARDDLDKESKKCQVYDVVFHPDTLRMAKANERFKKMINDTALDGIMRSFDVDLDKKNSKTLKMSFKGTPQATVIRKKKENLTDESTSPGAETNDDALTFPYPYDDVPTDVKSKQKEDEIKEREEAKRKKAEKTKLSSSRETEDDATVPKYSIVHRSLMDIQEYRDAPDARTSTRPTELVVTVELPLLKSAASVDLDILERKLTLVSTHPAAYKLDLNLPYPVDDSNGSAKFDKNKRKLTVTLPVVPDKRGGMSLDIAPDDNEPSKPESLPDLIPVTEDHDDSKPLVEVISSNDYTVLPEQSIDSGDQPDSSGDGDDSRDDKCIWSSEDVGDEKFVPKISYSFPANFSVNQDDHTVSCVIEVRKVPLESISRSFSADKRTVTLRFISVGAGGFPAHYIFCIQFPENCTIVPEQVSVDAMEQNVVMLLLKEKSRRGEWKTYRVGMDENHLEEKTFLTEESVGESLDLLFTEAQEREASKSEAVPPIKVADLNEEKLVIEVGDNPFISDSDTDLSPHEIEVVHQKIAPKIPSILKQRTVSESSDDLSSSWNGKMGSDPVFSRESSRQDSWSASETENGEGKLRKSVSFNEHIDMTTFRSTQAVTTMKTALKSKRRRQRKKEQRQDRRRRHNSTGSECSSSEDGPYNGVPMCSKKGTIEVHNETSDSDLPEKDVDRTSKSVIEDNDVEISDDKLRTSDGEGADNEVPEAEDDGVAQNWEDLGDDAETVEQKSEKSSAGELQNKIKVISKEAASDDEDDVIDNRTSDSGDMAATRADTVLNWNEKAPIGADPYEKEHKTKCAFDFSNKVMYDLDVD